MQRFTLALAWLLVFCAPAAAQQSGNTQVSFGGIKGDPSQPVTVTSQSLSVDEDQRQAVFLGDVLVVQGDMRLSADRVQVLYAKGEQRPEKLLATGNVILVNATDSAQSGLAEYVIADGLVTLWQDVVLTQGSMTFSAPKLVADLKTGLGQLEGGVTTIFAPKDAP
jgi:lipopolysaccharide export system protein LptA